VQIQKTRERDIGGILADGAAIDEALSRAGREALLRDKQLGLSVPVWRNGHTEWVPPDQIDALLRGTEGAPRPSRTK
jgi:hypothetical protein